MADLKPDRRLDKALSMRGVYAIATGTTLSAGFFLLPGLAAVQAGPAMVLAYLLAVVPLLPAMFSIVELATAMPRAGGAYYFLDRALGPTVGTIGGLGTWLVLMLKVSFALVGIGAYLVYLWPEIPVTLTVVGITLALTALNMFGSSHAGSLQVAMVSGLLVILALFIGGGAPAMDPSRFHDFLGAGWPAIMSTSGLVYISYIGITTVVSLSEEVRDPERNLPKGIFLTLGTAVVVYGLGTAVMVGAVPIEKLAGNLTPAAATAEHVLGRTGGVIISVAALLAFTSVANAGILSASRFPLAMSRDHLMPRVYARLGWRRIPFFSLVLTVGIILAVLLLLDPTKIAKLASAFQLVMFALVCLAVVVMRESRIPSYDPGYRSPWYPWMQIVGVIAPLVFITQMGWQTVLFTAGLIAAGVVWFKVYGRARVARDGAMFHVFERWGRMRYEGLDRELRGILKEKGLRDEDPFDEIVARSVVLDLPGGRDFDTVIADASAVLARRVPLAPDLLDQGFREGTRVGATPVSHGVALPHLRVPGLQHPELVVVRARAGLLIRLEDSVTGKKTEQEVIAVFFLVSPEDDPARHLRLLAEIAGRVESEDFVRQWHAAGDEAELKEVLLRDERYLAVHVRAGTPSEALLGRPLRELSIPEGSLIALIRRRGEMLVPRGSTVLEAEDRLTVIGNAAGVKAFRDAYGG